MFLAENKIGNVGMALGLPNFISGLSMFFLTMFAPLHNYSFLGSKILFLMIAWMCNASLLLANYGEKNLFLFLGCNFFFFFLFLVKNKVGNAGMHWTLPNFVPGLCMFFLTVFTALHNYIFLWLKY